MSSYLLKISERLLPRDAGHVRGFGSQVCSFEQKCLLNSASQECLPEILDSASLGKYIFDAKSDAHALSHRLVIEHQIGLALGHSGVTICIVNVILSTDTKKQ